MTESTHQSLFTVSNHHATGDEEVPCFDGDEPGTYHSYFENVHGDQSVFLHRRSTGEALLYCGDANWKAFTVIDGKPQGLVLSPDEEIWLQACCKAVKPW